MHNYLNWEEKTITDSDPELITEQYEHGFVFVRTGKGNMYKTRSLRVNLSEFELTSENRRIKSKYPEIKLETVQLPFLEENYDWHIHKLGKEFYTEKFGENTFSAAKIKTLLKDEQRSNFNLLLKYTDTETLGYAICYKNSDILHYAYPFYDFRAHASNLGMNMMINAIEYSKSEGCSYCYLGSVRIEADRYKLQFKGLQWFDGDSWQHDLDALKQLLVTSPTN